jgi:predicted transcriptional regulator
MTTKILADAMKQAEMWPVEVQEELAVIACEMDAALKGGVYHAKPEELAGIDRGLEDARAGRFATDADVAAVFAKHRLA